MNISSHSQRARQNIYLPVAEIAPSALLIGISIGLARRTSATFFLDRSEDFRLVQDASGNALHQRADGEYAYVESWVSRHAYMVWPLTS